MSRPYRYLTDRTSPNQNARPGAPTSITIHWWGNPSGQKLPGIVNWLCDRRAQASAHYVITSGTVACIVDPDRRAWHSGDDYGNDYSIGLELDPNASQRSGTMDAAAELIAGLRETYGDLPLYPHRHWVGTECPGNYDLGALDRLARGQDDAPAPAAPAPVTTAEAPAFPLPRRKGTLCYYGPADGPITSVSGMGPNSLVPDDVYRDGAGRWHSRGLATWQARLIARGWTELEEDGPDGRFGTTMAKVTRQFQGVVGEEQDGKIGPVTWRAAWEESVR